MIQRLSKDERVIALSGGMDTHTHRVTQQEKKKIWHLSHALLYTGLRGACWAYLFPGVDGRPRGGGGRADGGAGRGAGRADRVDLPGNVVDLAGQDSQVLSQVLADPAHTWEQPVNHQTDAGL